MAGLEGDTTGGFNSLIEKQRRQDGECYVPVVLSDNESEVIYTDGSATFSINKHGQLIWKDEKENAGKGLKFDKME